ncbi:MAG: sugar kinase, partial [Alphaproteobacteria bacterium]
FFTYYRAGSAASLMRPDDLPADAIRAARCLHLSGITLAVSPDLRRTSLAAIDLAAEAGVTVSLDTNLRLKLWDAETARRVILGTLERVRIVVTSIEDSLHLTGLGEPEAIGEFYRRRGPEIVLVTMGAQGCHLAGPAGVQTIPAAPAQPVDSTGAGDSFAGGFLAWWLQTGDPVLAARRAAIIAAGTVSGLGAVAPIPRAAEVLAREAELYGPAG